MTVCLTHVQRAVVRPKLPMANLCSSSCSTTLPIRDMATFPDSHCSFLLRLRALDECFLLSQKSGHALSSYRPTRRLLTPALVKNRSHFHEDRWPRITVSSSSFVASRACSSRAHHKTGNLAASQSLRVNGAVDGSTSENASNGAFFFRHLGVKHTSRGRSTEAKRHGGLASNGGDMDSLLVLKMA